MIRMLKINVEHIKTCPNDIPLILVGAGSRLIPEDVDLRDIGIS